jgi:cyclic pyranopterin phosphate synthase
MFSHLDAKNRPAMVNVGAKAVTHRTAHAVAAISLPPELAVLLRDGEITTKKGPIFHAAVLAGVMGAKKTSELIPLCHPLALTHISVLFDILHAATDPQAQDGIRCTATVETVGPTGVEMEALTAVQVALLTVYDMCKAVDRGMTITGVKLMEKHGGKSGSFVAQT